MTCKVCGREKEELEEEFGIEIEMRQHQNIRKCSKCIDEYERELGHDEDTLDEDDNFEGDWKNKVVA
ncbi:MAG: hypothetical protein ABEJ03_02295 [Candidatus Nanohaloarchaea archaeon]